MSFEIPPISAGRFIPVDQRVATAAAASGQAQRAEWTHAKQSVEKTDEVDLGPDLPELPDEVLRQMHQMRQLEAELAARGSYIHFDTDEAGRLNGVHAADLRGGLLRPLLLADVMDPVHCGVVLRRRQI